MSYFQQAPTQTSYVGTDVQSNLLRSVFGWMTIGLFLTAFVSALVISTPLGLSLMKPGIIIMLSLLELGLVFWLSARIAKMSTSKATTIFLLYSALNGVTLAPLCLVYTGASLTNAFVATAAMFAGMSFYGSVTKKDLSSWGSFLMMGLWGIIIASVVNIFLRSDGLAFVSSLLGVVLFTGLTAYEVNNIKRMSYALSNGSDDYKRVAISAALSLYLNFINLFISLLRFFGERRD